MTLDRLILMRHGETDWNASRRMQGHRDIDLNATGLAQAAAAAPSIAALHPETIVASDLRRAGRTAAIVGDVLSLPVRTDQRLRETYLGEWQGLDRHAIGAQWPDEWTRWQHRDARMAPPGGESRHDVAARAAAVVDDLDAAADRVALLVTHGGLIVGLTGRLLGIGEEHWGLLVGVANCHWVIVDRAAGRWRLHTYNGGLGGVVVPANDEDIVED